MKLVIAKHFIDERYGVFNKFEVVSIDGETLDSFDISKLPTDYLEFLREIGFGEIGGSWFMLYSGVLDAKDIFNEDIQELEKLLFFGDDMQGISAAIDTGNENSIVEVDSSDMSVLKVASSFTEYIESLIS